MVSLVRYDEELQSGIEKNITRGAELAELDALRAISREQRAVCCGEGVKAVVSCIADEQHIRPVIKGQTAGPLKTAGG